jgi:hypothetical protein
MYKLISIKHGVKYFIPFAFQKDNSLCRFFREQVLLEVECFDAGAKKMMSVFDMLTETLYL